MTSIIGAYFRTPRIQIAALLYFLIAGCLTQVPLFNYLGYEFSAVMTIPAAFISGILTLQFLREHRSKPLSSKTWLFVIIDYLHVNFLLLLIPLIVISLNALVVKNCAYTKGIAFYLLLPVVTMVFSVSLALFIGTIVKRSKTVFLVIITLLLSHIIFVTYFKPQLFAYNLIMGFFPGITYDETVGDMSTLIIFRQFTVVSSLLCLLLFSIGINRWNKGNSIRDNMRHIHHHSKPNKLTLVCIMLAIVTLVTGFVYRSEFGFEHSASDIQRELGRRTESQHFIFYYSDSDFSMPEMQQLKRNAEYHFSVVSTRLKTHLRNREKTEVYLYPNSALKQRLIGTANTNIAKPWNKEMHLTSSNFTDSFRHELVHVIAGDFGFPVIHASTRMGLNEGFAVAIDWEPGLFTPHQYAAALMRENSLENVSSLFSLTGFASQPGNYAYLVSGSFCKYLLDRFGIERCREVFPNGVFVAAFSESLESLIKDWKAFLKTVDASDIRSETVQAHFYHQPIFYKVCAREVSEKNQKALSAIRVKDYGSAQEQFTNSYNDAPTPFALRGILQSLISQKKYFNAIERIDQIPVSALIRTNPSILYLHADALFLSGSSQQGSELYRRIIGMKFSEAFLEAAALRNELLRDNIDTEIFHKLFYAGMEDTVKILVAEKYLLQKPDSPSMSFYIATILARLHKNKEALDYYKKVIDRSRNDILKYYSLIRTAKIEQNNELYEKAKSHFWNAKNFVPTPFLNEYIAEQIELCDILKTSE